MTKPTIFSGIQPTGNLHLGNYLGAMTQWVELQDKYRCIFCVVDYHAITVPQDRKTYHRQILDTAKIYLAAGIDPKKSLIFLQSDIKEHTELAWVLNCAVARMSDLNKMTQFKDKAGQNPNVGVGLFDYPVLMAADILLYQTDLVPVGEDQIQHVELARTLAKRFNHDYQKVFKIPEVKVRQDGARIMGLDDAGKKMSKSAASPNNYLALTDEPEVARKKIMKAQTDSDNQVKYDPKKKPAISNLLTIYSLLSGRSIKDLEKMYINKGYGDFKTDLAKVVVEFLAGFQAKFKKISDKEVEKILANSAQQLQPLAQKTMVQVKAALGL
ncbi:MAG: tryptophan--tRNA ligase [bacterium]